MTSGSQPSTMGMGLKSAMVSASARQPAFMSHLAPGNRARSAWKKTWLVYGDDPKLSCNPMIFIGKCMGLYGDISNIP